MKICEDPKSPRRCQNIQPSTGKQCLFMAEEDKRYCEKHIPKKEKEKDLRNYRLTKWKNTVQQKLSSPEIKSLREEVCIARTILQEYLEQIDPTDFTALQLYSPRVKDFLDQIGHLVTRCHLIEEKTGVTLDRTQLFTLVEQIIEIIARRIDDAAVIDDITQEISERIHEFV